MALKIQYLGWDAFVLTTDSVRVILDPFLAGSPEHHVPPSPISVDELESIDIVAVSHSALDHLGAAFEIVRKYNAKLVCASDVHFLASQEGIPDDKIALMVSGSKFEFEDITIKAVDARHISWALYNGHPVTGTPLSYVILTKEGRTLFFGGDTSLSYDLKLYGELYRPDIALLGVGGVLLGGRTIEEMDPYEASIAAEFLGAKTVVPMHYREIETAEKFKSYVNARLPNANVNIMKPGDQIVLNEGK